MLLPNPVSLNCLEMSLVDFSKMLVLVSHGFCSLQVKDILYHLYMTARGNLQRLMPKEIRILKYLLTIEDPEEKVSALKDAFTPGEELEGNDIDCLYTYVWEVSLVYWSSHELHACQLLCTDIVSLNRKCIRRE